MSETAEIDVIEPQFVQRSEIVNKLFSPKNEVDKSGFTRRSYRYGEVEFVFRGKEELPEVNSLITSGAKAVGSEPRNTSIEEYKKWRDEVENQNGESSNKLIASKDVLGVLALLTKIDTNNPEYKVMLDEVSAGTYGGKTLDLIDKLIACNWVKEDGNGWEDETVAGDAEALVIASVLGNPEAQSYVDGQLERMKVLDKKRIEKFHNKMEEEWKYSEERFSPPKMEELVGVHATIYEPKVLENGKVGVPTTADATRYEYVRNTVHVFLNGRVEGHMGGNWDKTPYTIISPLKPMLNENGSPTSVDQYDTWWVRNPGEMLKFPDASIVKPGNVPDGKLYFVGERETLFKGENYTLKDFMEIDAYSPRWDDIELKLERRIKEDDGFKSKWEDSLGEIFLKDCKGLAEDGRSSIINGLFINILLDNRSDLSIKDTAMEIVSGEKLRSAFKGSQEDFNNAKLEIVQMIQDEIEGSIFSTINGEATKATIKARGFPYMEELHGQLSSLARQFDALSGPAMHSNSIYHHFENGLSFYIGDAFVKNEDKEVFDWTKFNPKWPAIPDIDSKTRRVVYASGEFNARV